MDKEKIGHLNNMMVKLSASDIPLALERVQKTWTQLNPDKPFEYSFLDEVVARQYEKYSRWMKIAGLSTVFAILIFTRNLTTREQEKAKGELAEARRKVQSSLTEQDRLAAKILQFKLKLKGYFKKDQFDPKMRFSSCLVEYVHILDKKHRIFAEEIDINETELSQVINQHRAPAEYLFIRLEIHSNNNIPAAWWYRLVEKENEHFICTNLKMRQVQKKHVRNKLEIKV